MKKDILIIDTPFVDPSSNNRSNYIPRMLAQYGHKVEKVSSNFNHFTKETVDNSVSDESFNLKLLSTITYKKNLSIRRYLSQKVYSIKVRNYLRKRKRPDVIYLFVPSIDVGNEVRKYIKKYDVKLVIDIRDLWPEAFKMVINIPIFKDLIFLPITLKANQLYRSADQIIAVSDTYRDRALKVNSKVDMGHTIYLGTELKYFDADTNVDYANEMSLKKKIALVYVGTLGHSYDLSTTFKAVKILENNGYKNIEVIILGNGPLELKYKKIAINLGINVKFHGRLPYSQMVDILKKSDIALNPITKGAAQSIINKHADYAAAGLPVINTQESKEYRGLVDEFNIGLNCNNKDPLDMASKIEMLLNNKGLRLEMGKNHRRLAEERFDRAKTYKKIISLL